MSLKMDLNSTKIAIFVLSLEGLPGIGSKTVKSLLVKYRPLIEETEKLDADFVERLNIDKMIKALHESDSCWEELENKAFDLLERAKAHNISVLTPYMESYPRRLLRNKNFPPILFCKGDLSILNAEKAVAIVGTRNPTDFGSQMAHRLAGLLSSDGYVIVSGLAIGSDTAGHEGALDAGGKTIAILPTPLDAPVYPRSNQELANRIIQNGGALVSEYAPGIQLGDRQLVSNLVARDEWQSGLSDGVIAVETSVSGGTLHALRHAEDTETPIAVFDYSQRRGVDFFRDSRFGGNVEYLNEKGASPLYKPHTIEDFKKRMDVYRVSNDGSFKMNDDSHRANGQISLSFD